MSHTVESVNGCTKRIKFTFESLDLTNEIKAALNKKRSETNLKGFRKGKAPVEMVEKMYRQEVEGDALNRFVQSQLYKVLVDEDIKMVGYPAFENMNYESGKSVSFEAVVEFFPELKLKDMSKLSFKKESVEITDEEVESVKNNYLNSKSQMQEIKDTNVELKKGMFAVMNFEGVKEDGERPANMKGEEFVLEIGSGQFIPGFEEGMIGMKKGEKRNVALTFPSDYHAKDLQNGKVTFEVELLEIKEKQIPDLSDDLAKEFGFESAEDFMRKNRERLVTQKERQSKEKLNQEILEKLIEQNSFEIPNALLNQQEDHLKADLSQTLKQQGLNEKMMEEYFEKWQDDIKKKAEFQVRSGLILDQLARNYGIQVGETDLETKIEETAKNTGIDKEQVRKYYSSEQLKKNLMYAIREEKTFDQLLQQIKIN